MPPLKLLDTATTLRAKAATAAAGAAAAAKMAQDLLASRRAQREAAADLTAKKLTEIERTRRRLAEQLTPAELVALTETLRLLLIEARDRRHAQLEAEAALAEAEAALPAASAASVAAKNHLDGADAELAAAREGAERRAGLLLRLKTPPVSELKTTAQAVLADPAPTGLFKAAKTRVEGDVPTALRSRARARFLAVATAAKAAGTSLAAAEAAAYAFRQAELGPEVELGAARAAFAAAEAALATVVQRGGDQLALAQGLLGAIPASPKLEPADLAAISAAATLGAPAALLEEKRDLAAQALADKRAEIAAKKLALLALDVDTDLAAHPDVVALVAEENVLIGKLTTAQNNFTGADQQALDSWEAAVPDRAWANLAAFDRASAVFTELAATDAAALETNLTSREDALAQALLSADKHRRSREALAAEVAARRPLAEVAAAFLDRRQDAALRGDRKN